MVLTLLIYRVLYTVTVLGKNEPIVNLVLCNRCLRLRPMTRFTI